MTRKLLCALLAAALLLTQCAFAQEDAQGDAPEPVARTLRFGDSGEDVLALQTRLKELLYYNGPLSGLFAEVTQGAVKSVQAAYGLSQTGEADAQTQEIVFGECYRPLAYGSAGEDVKELQTRLTDLSYYHGKISGNFLDGSKAAISNFQKDNGLESTGIADVNTLALLYSDKVYVPSPTATPAPRDPNATVEPIAYPGSLSYGATGDNVKKVQERLKELGFFEGKTTTGFYAKTQAAVKKFQQYNALDTDGVVGRDTWEALFSSAAVDALSTPMPPTPVPYYIEVDVRNQVVKVFERDEAGEFTDMTHAFICSTGTTSHPSDVGVWTLSGRKALWATFPTWGGGYARYWTKINGNIAFHSVLYATNDLSTLKISSYEKLGSRASHGCIRLTVADSKWIYDHVGEGTQVYIYEDAASDPELRYSVKAPAMNKKTLTPAATPEPTEKPAYDSSALPPQPFRQLKVGKEGEDVYWLQCRLTELGYYTGAITGQYREGTRDAVKKFQRDNRLSADGVAGTVTLNKLYEDLLATPTLAPTDTPTPPPTATPAPTEAFEVSE